MCFSVDVVLYVNKVSFEKYAMFVLLKTGTDHYAMCISFSDTVATLLVIKKLICARFDLF